MQFTGLRLVGFKSFVEPTELAIEPGLTGIVGPNGCGKSNLVEALRWVMGETSARQMRGGEMDDVIFGGTAQRPPRNVAEVAIRLDNQRRRAAAPFNAHDEIEVTRRIERGAGSAYRVNGKEVRARDVQLLFADAATGARSTAIVSQGRIGAIINAKPSERRSLLEEAAGIGGLHSRRHEAELRLKAAEANLARLEDVLATLDAQLQGLRRQARQAQRYRNLSQQIREVEALLLAGRWLAALGDLEEARQALAGAEGLVAELSGLAAAAATAQAEAAAGLPALRQAEVEAAAALQRLKLALEQLDAEEGRLAAAVEDQQRRLAEIDRDSAREAARGADADQALARLAEEAAALGTASQGEAAEQETSRAAVEALQAAVATLDADLGRLMTDIAAADAERGAAVRRLAEAETRRQRLTERAAELARQLAEVEGDGVARAELTSAEMDLEAALEFVEEAREAAEEADRRRGAAQTARDTARDALQAAAAARSRLGAEADALKDLLADAGGEHAPVLDEVATLPGYEAALGAALGEDLSAPLDEAAPVHWLKLPPLADPPALPKGAEPLSRFVTAPPALVRRISQVGVVASAAIGRDLRHGLKLGQRLVSRDGDLWRWDGLTASAGAPAPAAVRLKQRNRLRELQAQIEDAEMGVERAEEEAAVAAAAVEDAAEAERQARDAVRRAEAEAARAREAHGRLAQKAAAAESRLAALRDTAAGVRADLAEAEGEEVTAREALAAFSERAEERDRLAALKAELAERRTALVEARSRHDRLLREAADRRRRLDAIAAETVSWRDRAEAARRHAEDLAERRQGILGEIERLRALPTEIADRRAALLDQIQGADDRRTAAAVALAEGERRQAEADRRLKDAEAALAAAREDRVRKDGAVAAAAQACRGIAQAISERLDCTPEALTAEIGDTASPPVAELAARHERLLREREAMGPVNLRAEQEAEELGEQVSRLQAERDDLIGAIAKLRQGIAELNREGRERLLASFNEVDRHFRELFVRLFGGGRAHLALTESDDPLAAGLEIMASPPGKRLQMLSLLSGGEQALTALAMLVAVFLTNPAPICVLDEVDAPLDDANVDRFCTLVAEIAHSSSTRFLVVTHHRMTMARMDRLFGVTMAERGVSQLVSVDLRAAEQLREIA